MTWPAIVDRRSGGTEARVALETNCSGHLLVTATLTVGLQGL
jgi:hypothetical protein